MVATAPREVPVRVKLRGGNWEAFKSTDPEILVEGGTGTGKTIGILHRMNRHAQEYPGYHGAIVRKTAKSLADSVLSSFQELVLHEWDRANRRSALDHVHFFGGSRSEPESYEYDNGSRIVVGGMDNPTKILGTEYDEVFYNQVEEGTLEDWETLGGRLRHGVMPFRALVGDCNPSYDRHWLIQRAASGLLRRIKTTIKDNPAYWDDEAQDWTALGREYLSRLEQMTGTRRQRFLLGEWVGMENAIYADALDAARHFVDLPSDPGWTGRGCGGMDFGRIHLSAVVALTEDHAGRLWARECWTGHNDRAEILATARRFRERYGIRRGVTDPLQDWASQDLGWTIAKSGAGSRKGRIQRVLGLLENDMLRFDRYGEGVQELWDELHMYRYEVKETDTMIDDVVVRKDDDRVAALEYAIEAWFMGQPFAHAPRSRPMHVRESRVLTGT